MALAFAVLDGKLHDRDGFTCGVVPLDDYLRRFATQHHRDGIATTHVLVDDAAPSHILGYCSLAAAQLHLQELNEADRRRLPAYPVPAVRVGRLAVAAGQQGKGYGAMLVGHAVNQALAVRQSLGVRVIVVDAKGESAAVFYEAFGFRRTAEAGLTLYLPVSGFFKP